MLFLFVAVVREHRLQFRTAGRLDALVVPVDRLQLLHDGRDRAMAVENLRSENFACLMQRFARHRLSSLYCCIPCYRCVPRYAQHERVTAMQAALLSLIGFSIAMYITPGPNNVMVAASAANHGVRATVPHMLGVAIGFTVMLTLVCA